MDWVAWALFGVVATVLLTAVMVAAHLVGISRLDFPLMWGTILVRDPDRARIVGFLVHLAVGLAFAFLYATAFRIIGASGLLLGMAFGTVHAAIMLVVLLPLLPGMHPRMASARTGPDFEVGLEPPGPLALNYGRLTPWATLAAHVVYGAVLGVTLTPG